MSENEEGKSRKRSKGAGKQKFYETAEFKTIQAEWYKKLELTPKKLPREKTKHLGQVRYKEPEYDFFVDIEGGKESNDVPTQIFSEHKIQYAGGTDYRNFCEQLLVEYQFENDLEKSIFAKHTEGFSVRQIEEWIRITENNGKNLDAESKRGRPFKKYRTVKITFQAINVIINRIRDAYCKQIGISLDEIT